MITSAPAREYKVPIMGYTYVYLVTLIWDLSIYLSVFPRLDRAFPRTVRATVLSSYSTSTLPDTLPDGIASPRHDAIAFPSNEATSIFNCRPHTSIWQHQQRSKILRCDAKVCGRKNGKLLQHVATPACDDQQDVETQQDNQKPMQGLAEEEFHQTTTARLQIHIHIWKQVHHFGKLRKMSLKWCTGGALVVRGWSRCQVGAKTFAEWRAATKMARLLCMQFDTIWYKSYALRWEFF